MSTITFGALAGTGAATPCSSLFLNRRITVGLYDAFALNEYKWVKIIRRKGYSTVEYAPAAAEPGGDPQVIESETPKYRHIQANFPRTPKP